MIRIAASLCSRPFRLAVGAAAAATRTGRDAFDVSSAAYLIRQGAAGRTRPGRAGADRGVAVAGRGCAMGA